MRSGYLIGMPRRVMDLLLSRNVGASLIVVHFVALLRLCTFARLANSQRPFRRGKKDFGLAVTQHVVATPRGVFKTRSLRRRPPSEQIHKALLESLKATPWDPKGSREEADNFVFPSLGPRPASQGVQPLQKPDTAELPDDQPRGEEELFQEAQESETCTSADVPVQDDMDIEELAEGLLKRAHEPAHGATSSAESSTSRPRVGPPPSVCAQA